MKTDSDYLNTRLKSLIHIHCLSNPDQVRFGYYSIKQLMKWIDVALKFTEKFYSHTAIFFLLETRTSNLTFQSAYD